MRRVEVGAGRSGEGGVAAAARVCPQPQRPHPAARRLANIYQLSTHLPLHLPQLVRHLHPLALQLVDLELLAAAACRRRCPSRSLWPLLGRGLLLLLLLLLLRLLARRLRAGGAGCRALLPRLGRLGPRHRCGSALRCCKPRPGACGACSRDGLQLGRSTAALVLPGTRQEGW